MRLKRKAVATSMQNFNAVALVVQEIYWGTLSARGWCVRFSTRAMATSMQNFNAVAIVVQEI